MTAGDGLLNFFAGLCACLILISTSSAQTAAPQFETDFQVWNDTQFIFPLNKKKDWNAVVWTFGRFGNTGKTATDVRVGGLITKRINKYLTFGGGYLYRRANPNFRQPRYESRYLGIATTTVPFDKKWTLVNRSMYQYENRYSRPNATVLRQRFWLEREITVGEKTKIEPFVSFEAFYDFRLKDFARYRTQAGFTRWFNARFAADFYYVHQNETGNRTRPGILNGIGSSFRVNLQILRLRKKATEKSVEITGDK